MWIIFNKEFLTKEEKIKKLKEVESQVDSQYFKLRIIQAFDMNDPTNASLGDTYNVQYQTKLNGAWEDIKEFYPLVGEMGPVFLYDTHSSFYDRSDWKFFQKLTYKKLIEFEKEEYQKLENFKKRPKNPRYIAYKSL